MNDDHIKPNPDAAADAWLELQLQEELGELQPPDLRHRLLASTAERRAHAAREVADRAHTTRWLTAAMVLVGIATVIGVIQLADDTTQPTHSHLQDPRVGTEPGQGPQELLAKSLEEFQRHAATATRIAIAVDPLGVPNSMRHLIEANLTIVDAATQKAVLTELRALKRLQPAGWQWSNIIRLDLPDGRFLTCAVDQTGKRRLGIRGLGDFEMTEPLRALLAPLVEAVALKTRLAGGRVISPEDLLPGRTHSIPADIEQLTCRGLADEDLALLARFEQLETLDLSGCAETIRGEGLSNLLMLRHLETLKLRYTQVADEHLATVGSHGALRHLDVSNHTRLQGVFLASFAATGALQSLKLGWGRTLTDAGLLALSQLDSLTHVDLSGRHPNEFTSAGLEALGRMKNLQSLTLDNLPVSMHEVFTVLGELTTLQELSATFTDASTLSLQAMRSVHRVKRGRATPPLRILNLTGCKALEAGLLEALGGFLDLEQLTLDRTSLRLADDDGKPTSETFEDLQRLHKLNKLDVSGLRLDANACRHIARLPRLSHLNLSFNGEGIDDDALHQLGEATELTHLALSGCDNFTDVGLISLRQLGKLKLLDLNACDGFTVDGLGSFRSLRPDCELRLPSRFR